MTKTVPPGDAVGRAQEKTEVELASLVMSVAAFQVLLVIQVALAKVVFSRVDRSPFK